MPCEGDENIFAPPPAIRCQCRPGCDGILRADGRNIMNTLTFLVCDVCGCAYHAEDTCEEGSKNGQDAAR